MAFPPAGNGTPDAGPREALGSGGSGRLLLVAQLRVARGLAVLGLAGTSLDRRADEAVEQRVRALGPALELRVELAGHEPGVVLELDDLDESAVRRLPGEDHSGAFEGLAV